MENSHWMLPANTLMPHDWLCSDDFGTLPYSVFVWQLAMCNWHLLLCPVPVNLLSTFFTIINCFCHAMVWTQWLITQQHFSFLLTLFWLCKVSGKCSSSPLQNDKLCTKNLCHGCEKVQLVFRSSLSAMSQLLQCLDLEANFLNQYLCRDGWSRWLYLRSASISVTKYFM